MSDRTGISWCDATVNFWWGCQEVSPGCDHCYARTMAESKKFAALGVRWGNHPRIPIKGAAATARSVNRRAVREGVRLRVFTNSMSDFFDRAADALRPAAWDVIRECPALDWLILTKRPQNIAKRLPDWWGDGPANIWLGASAENQKQADRRLRVMEGVPAVAIFASFEPLLSSILFRPRWRTHADLTWAIIGGESGKDRRDCGVDAITMLATRCRENGVATFVKQDCAFKPGQRGRIPEDAFTHEYPLASGPQEPRQP